MTNLPSTHRSMYARVQKAAHRVLRAFGWRRTIHIYVPEGESVAAFSHDDVIPAGTRIVIHYEGYTSDA